MAEPMTCVDCNQLADRERPLGVTHGGDLIVELVCRDHETGTEPYPSRV